jgi:RNA polymerase sigma factor (TIGR02999 family)
MEQGAVTQLLRRVDSGDAAAAEEFLPLVYDQLRRAAQKAMAHERADHTLQATALVHEAYSKLVEEVGTQAAAWSSRAHFYKAAAESMRRILVDHARARNAVKRGGGRAKASAVDLADLIARGDPDEILALDEALLRLEAAEPEVATIVRLRIFAGLTGDQTALALGMSARQVDRVWAYARAVLFRTVSKRQDGEGT